MKKWRVTGTKQGKLVTAEIEAADHGSAVMKASKAKGLCLVVHDCVLIESREQAMSHYQRAITGSDQRLTKMLIEGLKKSQ